MHFLEDIGNLMSLSLSQSVITICATASFEIDLCQSGH